jgi:hypothetical protein
MTPAPAADADRFNIISPMASKFRVNRAAATTFSLLDKAQASGYAALRARCAIPRRTLDVLSRHA